MSIETNNTFAELEQFSEKVVEKAKQLLAVKRRRKSPRGASYSTKINSSGRLSKSLLYDLNQRGDKITLDFGAGGVGGNYLEYVEEGRPPGKQPPISDILKWVRIKPLNPRNLKNGQLLKRTDARLKSMAYVIARKIGKYGTEATHFYTEAFIEEYNKLGEELQNEWLKDVEFNVDFTFGKLDNIETT